MDQREHPELGYRSWGVIILRKNTPRKIGKCIGPEIGGISFQSVKSILSKGLDARRVEEELNFTEIKHENIRGSDYYHSSPIQ